MKWTFKFFEPSRVRDLVVLDLGIVLMLFGSWVLIATQGKF